MVNDNCLEAAKRAVWHSQAVGNSFLVSKWQTDIITALLVELGIFLGGPIHIPGDPKKESWPQGWETRNYVHIFSVNHYEHEAAIVCKVVHQGALTLKRLVKSSSLVLSSLL